MAASRARLAPRLVAWLLCASAPHPPVLPAVPLGALRQAGT